MKITLSPPMEGVAFVNNCVAVDKERRRSRLMLSKLRKPRQGVSLPRLMFRLWILYVSHVQINRINYFYCFMPFDR